MANDAAIFVYHTQVLSDIPLTVSLEVILQYEELDVKVKELESYQDETERGEESRIPTNCS